jgi:uncharacterized protein (DUF433 family)
MLNNLLSRITTNSEVMLGKPVIKGTRLTVEYILNLLAQGESIEAILEEYEGLTAQDIYACLFFAAQSLKTVSFMPLSQQGGLNAVFSG